jgi:hypothetical protein
MQINKQIKEDLLKAINERNSDTFECVASGELRHFISSEGEQKGLYLYAIEVDDKDFKIYMI